MKYAAHTNGFTLVELMLVVALTLSVAGFLFPVGAAYLRMQVIDDTSRDITESLRTAWGLAAAQSGDSAHGVKFLSDSYVRFVGESYASRDTAADQVFSLPDQMVIGGLDEVVFTKQSGIPNATGTVAVALGDLSSAIEIDRHGKVTYQNK